MVYQENKNLQNLWELKTSYKMKQKLECIKQILEKKQSIGS